MSKQHELTDIYEYFRKKFMSITTTSTTKNFDDVTIVSLDDQMLSNNCAINCAIAPSIYPPTSSGLSQSKLKVNYAHQFVRPVDLVERSSSTFKLDDVIAEAISILSTAAIAKGVEIFFETNHEAIVYADLDMIFAMTHNLVANAIRYTHKHQKVRISSKIDQNIVIVAISNSGIGITKEQLNQLFQVDAVASRLDTVDEIVAGIELLLCHRFAEKNKGQLVVTSADQQGEMFTYTLPKAAIPCTSANKSNKW
jgi:signal transduction histidine kinase